MRNGQLAVWGMGNRRESRALSCVGVSSTKWQWPKTVAQDTKDIKFGNDSEYLASSSKKNSLQGQATWAKI